MDFKPLVAVLTAASFVMLPVAQAEVRTFEGTGECLMSEFETLDIVKQRAQERAEQNCVEQAGIYVKGYTRTVNMMVAEDEVTAIAGNVRNVTAVKFTTTPLENGLGMYVKAHIVAQVDSKRIDKWLSRDSRENVSAVSHYKDYRKELVRQDKELDELHRKIMAAPTGTEKMKLKEAVANADKRFRSLQMTEKVIRIYKDPDAKYDHLKLVKTLTKAIEIDGSNAKAYTWRAIIYGQIAGWYAGEKPWALNADPEKYQYYENLAHASVNKAIEVDPNYYYAYVIRALHYASGPEQAMADVNKAVEVAPDVAEAYGSRAYFHEKGNLLLALKDINKAIELDPANPSFYHTRFSVLMRINPLVRDETRRKLLQEINPGRGGTDLLGQANDDNNKARELENSKSKLKGSS